MAQDSLQTPPSQAPVEPPRADAAAPTQTEGATASPGAKEKPGGKPAVRVSADASGAASAPPAGSAAPSAATAPSAASASAAEPRLDRAAPPEAPVARAETAPASADPLAAATDVAQNAQPPAAASAHAAAGAAQVRGSPETVATLAAQIVKKLNARSTQFDLQLDPAGLGKVNVRVEIGSDGRVSAAMSFDNPQAAAELKSRASELQRALAQSGFDPSGGLSFDVAGDSGRGQQNPFQNNEQQGQAFRGRAFAAALENAGDAAQQALSSALNSRRATPTGVDVRI
jgi:Meckel syndrome type 1 protein